MSADIPCVASFIGLGWWWDLGAYVQELGKTTCRSVVQRWVASLPLPQGSYKPCILYESGMGASWVTIHQPPAFW